MAPKITLEHASDPAKRFFFPRRTRGSNMHVAAKDKGWGRGIIEGPDGVIGRKFDDPVSNGIYTFRPAPAEEASAVEQSTINNAFVIASKGPSSEGPADVAGPSQQQPPDQLRRPEAPPSLETFQPRRPETRGWLKEQGGAAGGAPSKSQYFTAELEEAYSAAVLAMVRRPEWYEAHGRDAPPHSVEHSSLAERLASMKVIR
ncbi:hypothetical protein COCSUDRAFT_52061 [Coccomyxa subellipsoidea C-169]|uniref:Uncharacterized protein n=1 Tax=Coccomyxa subellipsoidea (strain C-169) TaxID=574566 RepID=I0Z8S8_COCSC|nr:hypothetical protein COCSUDRAFT_52061 [Coccomyxa subellipsoidea C-169]EIE27047.1 hypothetical protein COCSUDRAFT_52061 [Coccomyxa subellipsoidea C-169]|eukprot:XP_005651591.1 hypothetical protein COCSUDRAFT_52061 [Coccomyxa subellipsoidea C-169]